MASKSSKTPEQKFFEACIYQNLDLVKQMLDEHQVDVNCVDELGHNALIQVGLQCYGPFKLIEFLLSRGADCNLRIRPLGSEEGVFTTILHETVALYPDLVELFLNHKANLLAQNFLGETVLYYTLIYDHDESLAVLLKYGCLLPEHYEKADYYRKFYQLCDCVLRDDFPRAELIMQNLSDVDFSDMPEISLLRFAILRNKVDWVKLFLDKGASIEAQETPGVLTILHEAVKRQVFIRKYKYKGEVTDEIINLIIDKGADMNYVNENMAFRHLLLML